MGVLCEKSTLSISHNAVHILIIILQHSGGMNEPSTKFLLLDQFVALAEAPPKHKTVLDNFPETLHKNTDITQSNATKYFFLIIFSRCLRYIISWHNAATLFWSSTDSFALYVCGSSMISSVSPQINDIENWWRLNLSEQEEAELQASTLLVEAALMLAEPHPAFSAFCCADKYYKRTISKEILWGRKCTTNASHYPQISSFR